MTSTTRQWVLRASISSFLVLTALAGESLADAISTSGPIPLAYIGPGAGLGAIGALLAVLGAVVLCVAGLILYPLQLLRNRLRNRGTDGGESPTQAKPSA